MATMRTLSAALLALLAVSGGAALAQQVVVHDPWLNWDFINQTGFEAYDFDIIVDSATFAPTQTVSPSGWTLTATPTGTGDTLLHWSGATPVPRDGLAHFGAYMAGSGPILDAYWTDATGSKLGLSLPITYEQTRVTYPGDANPAWLGMRLSWPDSFFDVYADYGHPIGLTGIQTFAEIPATALDLEDLNAALDLTTLTGFATDPLMGGPGGPPIQRTTIYTPPPDSFFDVFVALQPDFTPTPDFESLLYAQVVMDTNGDGLMDPGDVVLGNFWNLNSQSPEPSAALMLALGGVALALRRRPRG